MTDRQLDDAARWACAGGAATAADDMWSTPGQEQEPWTGTSCADHDPAPHDIGESG